MLLASAWGVTHKNVSEKQWGRSHMNVDKVHKQRRKSLQLASFLRLQNSMKSHLSFGAENVCPLLGFAAPLQLCNHLWGRFFLHILQTHLHEDGTGKRNSPICTMSHSYRQMGNTPPNAVLTIARVWWCHYRHYCFLPEVVRLLIVSGIASQRQSHEKLYALT